MPGDFTFGERRTQAPRDRSALLLAWLTNNYWTTNFRIAQPGPLKFHFELDTHAEFDPIHSARVAAFARGGLIAHPAVHADAIESGSLLQVDGEGVIVAAVMPDAHVVLQNLTDKERSAAVSVAQHEASQRVRVPARGFANLKSEIW